MMRGRAAAIACVIVFGGALPAQAQVTRVEIVSREPASDSQPVGKAGAYEILRGRIHGEVDPRDRHNSIIQDVTLAPRNARGKVEYVATFALAKPVDLARASGVLVYQVVNRGNGNVAPNPDGDIMLVSGWQGDVVATPTNQTIAVPVVKNADGSSITGPAIARFSNVAAGTNTVAIRLSSMGSGPPAYPPADLEQPTAVLTMHGSEDATGLRADSVTVPRQDWAFADCRNVAFPGTPDATRLCLKNGFDPAKLYELVYAVKDPLLLGLGLAATRDIVSFFRHGVNAATVVNPLAGSVKHAIAIGDSQSGNFIKTFIHLGFNQDLSDRRVWDGAFPRIAARQTPINFRFALPGGAATLFEPGSEAVVWWGRYVDSARGRSASSLLDRCNQTKTCPRIIEAFGAAEFWGLRMSPGLIGTDARLDIPLPDNVRRYYYPGTTHGGGRGGFTVEGVAGSQSGCVLPANPNPQAETTRALTRALIDWVVNDTAPPASNYPLLARGELVPATKAAIGFPDLPGAPFKSSPVNPVLDYDFGPQFAAADLSGVISLQPPRIRQTLPTYVPRVNADGNESSGVRSVLHQAPLGTYLGWNLTSSGFFAGQGCGFAGGYIPFARTRAERAASNDPRPSIEERYGTLEGYMCVVKRAVARTVSDRFLLQDDASRLLAQAEASAVLPKNEASSAENREIARRLCGTDSR
jgi:hypothetical protein